MPVALTGQHNETLVIRASTPADMRHHQLRESQRHYALWWMATGCCKAQCR
jgi:hypothetical protein